MKHLLEKAANSNLDSEEVMQETTAASIATEALKPLTGPISILLDALLAPRIQRVKNWAPKQDVKDRAGSIVVNRLLKDYLRQLLRRTSEITTIVFPQLASPSLPAQSAQEQLDQHRMPGRRLEFAQKLGLSVPDLARENLVEPRNAAIHAGVSIDRALVWRAIGVAQAIVEDYDPLPAHCREPWPDPVDPGEYDPRNDR